MTIYKVFGFLLIMLTISSCNQNKKDTSKIEKLNSNHKMEVTKGQGIVTKTSSKSFEETYNTLVEVITNNPNLKIIAELNHQANAASVGLELNPTRIIMFGNPKLGTPLMQNAQSIGLDLPQKILVWQDNDVVKVSYNDPTYLQERHGVEGKDEILQKIKGALDGLTNKAINPQ
ncbi:DUF302 domain-containing protein [Aquimarina sp. AD10]|uniref:DUF302 domain-containing protein n=1 Tax=Aquimarina TaxID=290174 RepID=UPI000E477801|nr:MULTISPECIES: DUF302 domain-containing protein [Aquimarina]AXT61022.1 DUF302 domain-containing protein [Aquimarina sp. AD10]RKM96320.1 DUF302 domain-containing protein [Aquimarina sp. AD10]